MRYRGLSHRMDISTANGVVVRWTLEIEICVVDSTFNPYRPIMFWLPERAVLTPEAPEGDQNYRLTGSQMYEKVFFALTPLDSSKMVVGISKQAVASRI